MSNYLAYRTRTTEKSVSGSRDLSLKQGPGPRPLKAYQYQRLPTPTSIRLIEWSRALVPTADLRFSLKTIDLAQADHPSYTAISYCWGANSANEAGDFEITNDLFTNTVICDGDYIRVTENAYMALSEVQWRGRAPLFWLDAVCIDQSNDRERSEQVAIMGQIFAEAERTIVWLGEDDESAYNTHRVLQGYYLPSRSSAWSSDMTRWFRKRIEAAIAGRSREMFGLSCFESVPTDLVSVLSFFSRPWFRRTWIIQEVVLAKQLWIICGGLMFNWQAMVDLAHDTDLDQTLRLVEDDKIVSHGLYGLWVVRMIALLRGDHSSLQEIARSVFGSTSDTVEFYAVLGTLIGLFSNSLLSDSRDRIYAPLALTTKLCKSRPSSRLQPDYRQSAEDIFTIAARYFIQESQSLSIFAMSRTTTETSYIALPSWVPDPRIQSTQKAISALCHCNATQGWTHQSHRRAIKYSSYDTDLSRASCLESDVTSFSSQPVFLYQQGSVLEVAGLPLSTISTTTRSITALVEDDQVLTLLEFVHLGMANIPRPHTLSRLLFNVFTFGASWSKNSLVRFGPDHLDFAIWLSFRLLCSYYQNNLSAEALPQVFDLGDVAVTSGFCSKHAALAPVSSTSDCIICRRQWENVLSSWTFEDFHEFACGGRLETHLSGQTLATQANIIHNLSQSASRAALLETYLYHAYRFHVAIQPYIADRSLFLTDSRGLGVCPRTSIPGDEIWFLVGARTPVILRPTNNGNFHFVGEAYMEGYMQGEICRDFTEDAIRVVRLE